MKIKIKLEGEKKRYTPKDSDPIHCPSHNVTVTWGELDPIQQLAVSEGLDTLDDLPCIMLKRS